MLASSFVEEELKKIDWEVSQKKTVFTFDDFSLVELLPFVATEQVFFFESKEEDFSFLGLGKSQIFSYDEISNFIVSNPTDVLAYQDSFEQDSHTLCYLPEWCFVRKNGNVTLRVYHSSEYQSYSPSNIIFNLTVWESFVGQWISYEEKPESDEWKTMIDQCLRLLNKKELEKIVLSRKKIFTYDSPIEMLVMFREFYLANKNSSHFSIYHQFNYEDSFISLTPERLFTLKGNKLETISLAGSIARGENDQEDQELEETLIQSDKLILEHGLVTKTIVEKLALVSSEIETSPLFTMKLPYIQHRQAVIKSVLNKKTSIIDLINLLHPTPAVGGIPIDLARIKILEIEKENRRHYAAPVGVISHDFSEIVVGIRASNINGPTLTVYGGAGIVLGSEAQEEWKETGAKMQPFIKVINKSAV